MSMDFDVVFSSLMHLQAGQMPVKSCMLLLYIQAVHVSETTLDISSLNARPCFILQVLLPASDPTTEAAGLIQ